MSLKTLKTMINTFRNWRASRTTELHKFAIKNVIKNQDLTKLDKFLVATYFSKDLEAEIKEILPELNKEEFTFLFKAESSIVRPILFMLAADGETNLIVDVLDKAVDLGGVELLRDLLSLRFNGVDAVEILLMESIAFGKVDMFKSVLDKVEECGQESLLSLFEGADFDGEVTGNSMPLVFFPQSSWLFTFAINERSRSNHEFSHEFSKKLAEFAQKFIYVEKCNFSFIELRSFFDELETELGIKSPYGDEPGFMKVILDKAHSIGPDFLAKVLKIQKEGYPNYNPLQLAAKFAPKTFEFMLEYIKDQPQLVRELLEMKANDGGDLAQFFSKDPSSIKDHMVRQTYVDLVDCYQKHLKLPSTTLAYKLGQVNSYHAENSQYYHGEDKDILHKKNEADKGAQTNTYSDYDV